MNPRNERLLARYRVISLERLRAVRARLDGVVAGNAEALNEVRRELHNLKGDSHLLGQVLISELAHACEGRLEAPDDLEAGVRALGPALEAIKLALREEATDPEETDHGLREALAVLTGGVAGDQVGAPIAQPREAVGPSGVPRDPAPPGAAAPTAHAASADPSSAGHSSSNLASADPSSAAPSSADPSSAAPSSAGPSNAGRSSSNPASAARSSSNPVSADPSSAGPSSAGRSGADPSSAGRSSSNPASAAPSSAGPSSSNPASAAPSSAGPSSAAPSSAIPVTEPASRAAAPLAEPSRWMYVNAHDVDAVCERLSALHADLGRIHATLRGMLSRSRDTMHDVERLRADLDEIVSSAWALRLAPVHPTLAELGEHALELAKDHGKQLRIRIDDGGALVERRLLDEVREPLLHLVRNAVDHGIEPAHERSGKPVPAEIVLSAEARADHVVITVADDGRGIAVPSVRAIAIARGLIDPKTVLTEDSARELLFLHGFSTRQGATNLSGRGVGLDAVRRRLTAIGGWVSVANNPGGGTRFAIHIPSTVFRERVLIADVGGALCALPAREVEAVVPIGGMVEPVGSTPLLRYDGEGIPFLQLPLFRGGAESTRAAIVTHSGRRWAIPLPDVVGDVEMLRAPVDPAVASLGPFAASGTLDDGRLVLVVSLDALLSRPRPITEFSRATVRERPRRVLVVDDSPIVRDLLSELLTSVGLDVRSAGDGAAALASHTADPVDLIVCDVEMPVMDGFELLRRLRARSERVPVVMVTTRGSAADRSLAAALGADALIVKSEYENAHLLATVRRFVEIGA